MHRTLRRELPVFTLVFLLFLALTSFLTYPQVRHLTTGVNDAGDPLLNVWAVAWIAHQLPFSPGHIFDANIFYPERRTLAYSEALLVPGVLSAPIIWLGGGPVLAYNLLFLSGFVFSGVGTFLLVRLLTGRTDAAILSGIFFAFQPYRIDHYPHLQMQMTQFMPLALWALHRAIASGRVRDGVVTGLFVACTALSSTYYGVFFAAYLAVVGIVLLLTVGRERFRRVTTALAVGAVLCGAVVQPAARAYLMNRKQVGERSAEEAHLGSAEPRNYLATTENIALYGWTSKRFGKDEARLFPGATVTALAIVGAWPPWSPASVAYTVGTFFAFDVSLGWNGLSYPVLYKTLQPFRALRVPARMGILVGLSLSILAGFGVARIMKRIRRVAARVTLTAILATAAAFEYRPVSLSLFDVWPTVPSVYESMPADEEGALLDLPLDVHDPSYMYFSTTHWRPLLNGYSGFFPRSYMELRQQIERFPSDDTIAYLQRRRVRFLVLHEKFYDHEIYSTLVEQLQMFPQLQLVVTSRWEGAEVRLYRVKRMSGS